MKPPEVPLLRVALLTTDVANYACPQIRLVRPLARCADRAELTVCSARRQGAIEVDRGALRHADVVVVQRFFPQPGTARLLEEVLARGRPVVYETDDNLLEIPPSNPAHKGSEPIRDAVRAFAPRVRALSVSTRALGEAFAALRDDAVVLPNRVDRALFEAPVRGRSGALRIGYVGTATHGADLALVEPALERIARRYGDRVQLVWFGCSTGPLASLPGSEILPFVYDYAEYAEALRRARLDLVLAPLVDDRFNRCKSNIKWLELSAAGVPGVYADLEPYRESIEPGATGLLAGSDPDAWYAAIERVIEDEPLRLALARRAQADVLARWTLETGAASYARFYEEIAASGTASASRPPRCSIVIPVWNRADLTAQCLDSLRALRSATAYEVVVVDNGSTDHTARVLEQRGWVRVVRNPQNLGFAVACNQGARAARGDVLVFLNNDTIPLAGWLDALAAVLDADPGAGIVGAKLLYPNRTVQHAGIAISRDYECPYLLYRGLPEDDPRVNRRRALRAVTGACLAIRGELFRELGGFDEGYRNSFEDADLCLRAVARGWRVIYEPASALFHLESQTPGRSDHDRANFTRFRARWPDPLWVDEDLRYFEDGAWLERYWRDGRERLDIRPLGDPNAWAYVAQVERLGPSAGIDAVRALLADVAAWPDSPEVLGWAARACRFHGLRDAAARFEARAAQKAEPPPVRRSANWLQEAVAAQLRGL
jgi:GT2 family glycosyltransferase